MAQTGARSRVRLRFMADDTLFGSREDLRQHQPLAARLRPTRLDDVVGFAKHLEPGRPLRRLLDGQRVPSVILYGPAGCGKTTIAMLLAGQSGFRFIELSAVSAGIKDVREAIAEAQSRLQLNDIRTLLFIDEIHRFSKTQQDALLPAVESGTITLIAATTENPTFSVVSPLLSRSVVIELTQLSADSLSEVLNRAMSSGVGLAKEMAITEDARTSLITLSDGDARRMLTALEVASEIARTDLRAAIAIDDVSAALSRALPRYDKLGDRHYDVAHLFIVSMRSGDTEQALHWLALMLRAGEDPRFIARRIVIFASEDIGLADSQALVVAQAAAGVVERVGMPECTYALAHAVMMCAKAPKSREVTDAIGAAFTRIDTGETQWSLSE